MSSILKKKKCCCPPDCPAAPCDDGPASWTFNVSATMVVSSGPDVGTYSFSQSAVLNKRTNDFIDLFGHPQHTCEFGTGFAGHPYVGDATYTIGYTLSNNFNDFVWTAGPSIDFGGNYSKVHWNPSESGTMGTQTLDLGETFPCVGYPTYSARTVTSSYTSYGNAITITWTYSLT